MIHPTAIIDPAADLDEGVEVGPYAVIGAGVRIGAGTSIGPHSVLRGPTTIGLDNRIFQFASVGEAPQDKKYGGEETHLEIGDRNVIREFVTVHRGPPVWRGMSRWRSGPSWAASPSSISSAGLAPTALRGSVAW